MQQFDNDETEYPDPETVLAIRGAIATGQRGGPMGQPGHWLNEFWQLGAQLRNAGATMATQDVKRSLLVTSSQYLRLNQAAE